MTKRLSFAGAMLLACSAAATPALAKTVTYEVEGQRYSYSTNNNAQTVAARRHLAAAQAYAAAKAKVEAERSSNPLASVFGSSAQRELDQAKAALDQARPGAGTQTAVQAPARQPARDFVEPTQTASISQPEPAARPVRRNRTEAEADEVQSQPAKASTAPAAMRTPQVKQVSFDAVSGIKTTFMTDGSVHEEPFDGAQLPTIATGSSNPESLTAFVEKVRPGSAAETRGSAWTAANPDDLKQRAARP